ncbi:unnamed protein product [Prunus armeniaca]
MQVAPLSPGTRVLSPSAPSMKKHPTLTITNEDERLKELPKLSVKLFLHASGNIATTFPYDQVLVGAVRKIPKSSWNAKERLWMFPISSLSSAEKILHETSGVNVEVENVDPLVHRAIAAASVFRGYSRLIHSFSSHRHRELSSDPTLSAVLSSQPPPSMASASLSLFITKENVPT